MKLATVGLALSLTAMLWSCGDEDKKVTSDDNTPPAAITDLAVDGAHSGSMSLLWTTSGDDNDVGCATQYDIRYSSNPITAENWDQAVSVSGEPYPDDAGYWDYMTISGLEPETRYYFALKVADEVPNWSPMSNVGTEMTLPPRDTTAPARILNLSTGEVTEFSIAMSWTAPGDDTTFGTASEYAMRFSVFPIVTDDDFKLAATVYDLPVPQAGGTAEHFTVRNLVPNTFYFFNLKSADENENWSIISNTVTARTLPAEAVAPAPVTDLSAGEVTFSSVELRWTASGDDDASGTASVYEVRYYGFAISESNWPTTFRLATEPTPQTPGSTESMVIYGLRQATPYWFALKVGDEVPNWSMMSNVVTVTTTIAPDVVPPSQITDLRVLGVTRNTITVWWLAPGDDLASGRAAAYDLRFSTTPLSEAGWNGARQVTGEQTPGPAAAEETFTITNLKPQTAYYIAVKTTDEVGNVAPLSNIVIGKTTN